MNWRVFWAAVRCEMLWHRWTEDFWALNEDEDDDKPYLLRRCRDCGSVRGSTLTDKQRLEGSA